MNRKQIFKIHELPRGSPLERPLHRKRIRAWNPLLEEEPPRLMPVLTTSANPSDAPAFEHVVEVVAVSEEEDPAGVPPTSLSPAFTPSPAFFIEYGGGGESGSTVSTPTSTSVTRRRIHPRRRPLTKYEIEETLNFGSDMESNDSADEEEAVPTIVPRVIREAMDTPEDDEPEPPAAPTATSSNEQDADIYSFQWREFPNPLIPPTERREAFTQGQVGPTSPCVNAYEIFTSIWDDQIMAQIVTETNRYAQELAAKKIETGSLRPDSRIGYWKDTTVDECYVYLAIVMAMGFVVKSQLVEYWNSEREIFSTPGFSAHMSLKRFQLLNTCHHFSNNRDMRVEELTASEARLFKIAPIVKHLNAKFQTLYTLNQNIALDESLLQWKGWLDINQFIPNKAARVGIKTYEVCESETGYLWRFKIHAHNKASSTTSQELTPLDASTPSIVLELLQGLEHRGHTVYMDNFYNSPVLARKLKSLGFDVVGTLRTNRLFVPEELARLTKGEMRPGDITGYTSGDVDVMVWRDKNRIATISTYHGNATAVSDGQIKPTVVLDYNIMMGGVDKKDGMLAMYPVERKRTSVWYKKLFRRLLNVSVLNSYIIYKKSSLQSSHCVHRTFRHNLIISLLSRHSTRNVARPLPQNAVNVFEAKTHYVAERAVGQNKSRLRRKCCMCPKLTHFYCVGCDKSVCLTTCFVSLHS